MLKEIHQTCERLNQKLGISIPLPEPGAKALRAAAACHLAVGAGLLAIGLAAASKWCAALGCAALVSGAVMRREGRDPENRPR